MTGVLFVDAVGGAAGDMLLAALLDAGAPLEAVRSAVDATLPGMYVIETAEVTRSGFRARLLTIEPIDPATDATATPRTFADLLSIVERAALPEGVRHRARRTLECLGAAEGRIHGVDPADLALHELGDDDTLIDVVGVAAALHALDVGAVFVSSIPLGMGGPTAPQGRHVHGAMPLPATATLELLRGFEVRGGVEGETVTPTAAALFAALAEPARAFPPMGIQSVGYGAGTRDVAGHPNVVRVVVGTAVNAGEQDAGRERDLVILEANLDDLTPELVADAALALHAAGAMDVWATPVLMKKARPGVTLSALAEPAAEGRLRNVFFQATTTFGVRTTRVRRSELDRRTVSVSIERGTVRVKVGLLDGRVVSATPEHDDVAELAAGTGLPVRVLYEEAVAAARALRYAGAEE